VTNHGAGGVVWYTLAALLGWYVWAALAFAIGTRLLPGPQTHADVGELLRTIGFSSAPGVLRILALFPQIAGLVFLVSTLWMLIAMVIAVRQALDYTSTGRAIAVCAIGFPVYAVTLALSLILLGPWLI
jgi:Yip1-like protein